MLPRRVMRLALRVGRRSNPVSPTSHARLSRWSSKPTGIPVYGSSSDLPPIRRLLALAVDPVAQAVQRAASGESALCSRVGQAVLAHDALFQDEHPRARRDRVAAESALCAEHVHARHATAVYPAPWCEQLAHWLADLVLLEECVQAVPPERMVLEPVLGEPPCT